MLVWHSSDGYTATLYCLWSPWSRPLRTASQYMWAIRNSCHRIGAYAFLQVPSEDRCAWLPVPLSDLMSAQSPIAEPHRLWTHRQGKVA